MKNKNDQKIRLEVVFNFFASPNPIQLHTALRQLLLNTVSAFDYKKHAEVDRRLERICRIHHHWRHTDLILFIIKTNEAYCKKKEYSMIYSPKQES